MDVLQFACQNGCEWYQMTCVAAARGGHLAVLQFACQTGCYWAQQCAVQRLKMATSAF